MEIAANSVTYASSNAEYVDNKQDKSSYEKETYITEVQNQSYILETTDGVSENYEDVTYSREDVERTGKMDTILTEKIMENIKGSKELELIPVDENLPHEIYAISIYDGKVHVQGGEGYENKAMAYEKLLNASLKYQFQWKWGGKVMSEETILNSLSDMLSDYYRINDDIAKDNPKDSIVNHVGEAFEKWYQDNKPSNQFFSAKA